MDVHSLSSGATCTSQNICFAQTKYFNHQAVRCIFYWISDRCVKDKNQSIMNCRVYHAGTEKITT